jgi:hypothetical protein
MLQALDLSGGIRPTGGAIAQGSLIGTFSILPCGNAIAFVLSRFFTLQQCN